MSRVSPRPWPVSMARIQLSARRAYSFTASAYLKNKRGRLPYKDNARCAPPWSQHELKHKLRSALTHPGHTRPRGYLLQDAGDELEHDIVPFGWADVFQQAEVDPIGERVALTPGPVRFRTPSSKRCTLGSGSGSSRCSSSAPTARGR